MRPAGLVAGANLLERSAVKRARALVVERRAALVAQEEERWRQPRFPLVD